MKASCGISPLFRSDHQLGADILLKRFALDQLLRANEQDEGTLGRTEHTADLVDTDVALLGGLLGGESQLEVNGISFDLIVFSYAKKMRVANVLRQYLEMLLWAKQ